MSLLTSFLHVAVVFWPLTVAIVGLVVLQFNCDRLLDRLNRWDAKRIQQEITCTSKSRFTRPP